MKEHISKYQKLEPFMERVIEHYRKVSRMTRPDIRIGISSTPKQEDETAICRRIATAYSNSNAIAEYREEIKLPNTKALTEKEAMKDFREEIAGRLETEGIKSDATKELTVILLPPQ